MIISSEQIRLALDYLREQDSSCPSEAHGALPVSPEFMDQVLDALNLTPDVRVDRVAQARELLASEPLTSQEVADKMIGRIMSDSIR